MPSLSAYPFYFSWMMSFTERNQNGGCDGGWLSNPCLIFTAGSFLAGINYLVTLWIVIPFVLLSNQSNHEFA